MFANISFRNGDTLMTNIDDRYTPEMLSHMMIATTGNSIVCKDDICGYHRINIINMSDVKLIQIKCE